MAKVETAFYNPEKFKGLSINDLVIFLTVDNNKNSYNLNQIKWATQKEDQEFDNNSDISNKVHSFNSYDEFKKKLEEGQIIFYMPQQNGEYIQGTGQNCSWMKEKLATRDEELQIYPKQILDKIANYESTTVDVSKQSSVQSGMSRTVKFTSQNWSTDDNYVMVKLKGKSGVDFFKKSELFYWNGGYENIKGKTPDELTSLNISTSNEVAVETIYTEQEYVVDKLLSYKKLDLNAMEELTCTFVEGNGDDEVTARENLPRYFSVQTPVTMNVRKADTTKQIHMIKGQNYELVNQGGTHILVKPKYLNGETLAKKEDIFLDESLSENIKDKDLTKLVGKKLYLRIPQLSETGEAVQGSDSKILELAPLTMRQLSLSYSEIKSLQPSLSPQDILKDNAYMYLSNGVPVPETKLANPIGYKIVEDQKSNDFDCFVVTGSDSKQYILQQGAFNNGPTVKHKTEAGIVAIKQENAVKVKRTLVKDADVIQTTSVTSDKSADFQKSINSCVVLGSLNERKFTSATAEEKTELFNQANTDFLNEYKKGTYILPSKVEVDGEWQKLGSHKRYTETNVSYREDKAHAYYASLSTSPLEYVEKDGVVQSVGGPKYDAKKANVNFFKKWAEITGQATMAMSMGGGIIGVFALPFMWAGSAAVLTVGGVGAVVANQIIAKRKNKLDYKWKHKTDINRPKWEQSTEKTLVKEYERLLDLARNSELDEMAVRVAFQKIKNDVAYNSNSQFQSNFQIINGKAKIDENNAAFAHSHQAEVQPLINERNAIVAQLAKLQNKGKSPEKIEALKKRQAELDFEIESRIDARMLGETFKETEKTADTDELARTAQSFLLIKYCGVEADLNDKEKEFLKNLSFDVKNNQWIKKEEDREVVVDITSNQYKSLYSKIVAKNAEFGGELTHEVAPVEEEIDAPADEREEEHEKELDREKERETEREEAHVVEDELIALGIKADEYISGKLTSKNIMILIKAAKTLLALEKEKKKTSKALTKFVKDNAKDFKLAVDSYDLKGNKAPQWLLGKINEIIIINNMLEEIGYTNIYLDFEQTTRISATTSL